MKKQITIRLASFSDQDSVWKIIKEVISAGDTYVFAPDSDRDSMINYWFDEGKHTYVATIDDSVVGTFFLKENFPGHGSHIANASYMTSPEEFGKGIGSAMAEFSLAEAKRLGFKAMQFNIVVKSNTRAIALWKRFGFEIKGEIPGAFKHPRDGYINAYIMWRGL